MPFNSASYYRNKWRRQALDELAKARDIKARRARGEAYDWESIPSAVRLARTTWQLYLSQRTICDLQKERRKLR